MDSKRAVHLRHDVRLPIYESLVSEWFSRRRRSLARTDETPPGDEPAAGAQAWKSVSDEGWRAAKAAAEPTVGPATSAGLPQRVPQANIVPGSAATRGAAPPGRPALSPENARNRMAGFQQGTRRARAAVKREDQPDR